MKIMNDLVNLTRQDVKDAFLKLVKENDVTTTKEVKEYLRENNFRAYQSYVSKIMNETFNELNMERVHNGTYFVYSEVINDDLDDDDGIDLNSYSCLGNDADTDTDEVEDEDEDEYEDDDTDNDTVIVTTSVKSFTARQLRFRKDSNMELKSKLKNPKYSDYYDQIQDVLTSRQG